ncbi:gliding motility-associated C-terminal domain-containing protein [Maribellus mangrovi]|uniref:T9SS type B sorting domain-containing protein n=1 Tax=Maribellus mangrovi TaxID=3133146 RepID=UPI0030EE139F
MKRSLYLLVILFLFSTVTFAQITAPDAVGSDVTQYPVYPETDDIFVFCNSDSISESGSLTVSTTLSGTKTFLWEKYNEQIGDFEFYSQESSDLSNSQINGLADGCYRATVTLGATTDIYRAWVLNNWMIAEAVIDSSDCESFSMSGSYSTATFTYYDLSDNSAIDLPKQISVEWLEGSVKLSSLIHLEMFNPPTQNTDYTLRVFDQYNCEGRADVTYESIVTKADFSASPMSGEAPLTVTFSNNSENGTSGYYEWHFYRDIDEIKKEFEETGGPVDSVYLVAYDDAPVYTYENSGSYLVKLIAKHISEEYTCVDTFLLSEFIVADTSFVLAPNVFTPNGDGVNDEFVIKFWSMKNIEINIYNRWGKRVHHWQSGDVQGFEDSRSESVWDGRIGGGTASPGVYYWDVVGRGRDGRKRTEHGFLHLFREKD